MAAMMNRRILRLRLIASATIFVLPGPAHAEPIVFDAGGVSFFVIATVITGSLAWWRHTAGDRLGAVAVWVMVLATALMMTRYGPNDTLRFFVSVLGA